MVVSKEEFNRALREINTSYAKLTSRIENLEAEIEKAHSNAKAEEAAKPTATRKRSTKEGAKDAA